MDPNLHRHLQELLERHGLTPDDAATIADDLAAQLHPTVSAVVQRTLEPLLGAVIHYALDASQAGDRARDTLRHYYATHPPALDDRDAQVILKLIEIFDGSSLESREQWSQMVRGFQQQLRGDGNRGDRR